VDSNDDKDKELEFQGTKGVLKEVYNIARRSMSCMRALGTSHPAVSSRPYAEWCL
jgi:hypothetical protein